MIKCIHCGGGARKHKERETEKGIATQYRCEACGRYFTIYEEDEDTIDDSVLHFGGPRILVFDIETAPIRAEVWRVWKENIGANQMISDWYMLTWSAKWLGEEEVFSDALPYHKLYDRDRESDKDLLKKLWDLIDEADLVVAHNGYKFDVPKMNTRFLINGYQPPSPYKILDTLQVAKRTFGFTRNNLDFIGQFLNLGQKKDTGGHALWTGCLDGDPTSWDKMVTYNEQDVLLLESVYVALRPWIRNHPNYGVYTVDNDPVCTCGSKNIKIVPNKFVRTNLSAFQMYRCDDCGHVKRGRVNLLSPSKRKSLLANAL